MFSAASKTDRASGAVYIEDVFSTTLYTGTGSAQTITNNINLSGVGGLVWIKGRSGATDHALYDTSRGATFDIASNLTTGQTTQATGLTAFNNSGFNIGALAKINTNGATYASWAFREQSKFFDVVTYTGNGANRTIAHNLGSVPGCIIIKRTDTTAAWAVYHRSLANTQYLVLNTIAAAATGATYWNSTTPTASVFSLGTATDVNANNGTYVAYLFAHNAGGFGLTGSDNVISCGSFVGNATINLGYEPQFLLFKSSTSGQDWYITDTTRGFTILNWRYVVPSSSVAEAGASSLRINNTGFQTTSASAGETYIYIAIRRGLMKAPTSGTSVFFPLTVPQADSLNTSTVPFQPDLVNTFSRTGTSRSTSYNQFQMLDRLRGLGNPNPAYTGNTPALITSSTAVEDTTTNASYVNLLADSQNITRGTGWNTSGSGNWINYFWRRAASFFDVNCYTGNGLSSLTLTHNLQAVPELMIVKSRSVATSWAVYSQATGNTNFLILNQTNASAASSSYWNNTSPTSTQFTVGNVNIVNGSSTTHVAYLFASCPGVSKVGSYTGTGALQTVNCGFSSGARFVLIKRTDSAGDWWVYDSARGITSGNDPYLFLNSTAAEVANTNYVDTDSTGFQVTAAAPAGLNANGGTYIFLAVA